jgi:diaminopropionate ammonia-lyase
MMPSRFHLASRARSGEASRGLFADEELATARRFFDDRPELKATPLRAAPALSASLGLGSLWLKDETDRFGLPAFKSLGAHFAVAQLAGAGRLLPETTLVCASEGNHGRAVARAARLAGLAARVYVGARVAQARADAIRAEGATVVRTGGTYDEAVRTAADDAARHGWMVVSDTGWAGYDEIPRLIMLGYTQMMEECARVWRDAPPDLVVVQGGVGGLAGAVASWWSARGGQARPRLVCVEPLAAPCLQASAAQGLPVRIEGPLDTIMGGLRCGEVSATAFPAVEGLYDAYVAIDDEWAREGMRRLARPSEGDPAIMAGPSGAAGVGALLALASDPALSLLRERLGLGARTSALAIVTEGVTEPDLFAATVA